MDNLVDFYLAKIKDTNNAGEHLYKLYNTLFNAKWSQSTLMQFHRMTRTYGRYRVFFALLDIYDSYVSRKKKFITENPYPLIVHVIKNSLKEEYEGDIEKDSRNLSKYIEEVKKHLKEKKIFIVPDNFKEG